MCFERLAFDVQGPGGMPMDFDFSTPVTSPPKRMPLTERVSSIQQESEPHDPAPHTCRPQMPALGPVIEAQRIVTGSSRELSPTLDMSYRQSRSSSLQIPRLSASHRPSSRCTSCASLRPSPGLLQPVQIELVAAYPLLPRRLPEAGI